MSNDEVQLEVALQRVADEIVPILRRVYEQNARRFDPQIGDDRVTFGIAVYRNSWAQIEEQFADVADWNTSRPEGSLLITDGRLRVHMYKFGADEYVDIEAFNLDGAQASETKSQIARSNATQLALDLFPERKAQATPPPALTEFVIVHAGNPDDACCSIWIGAPTARDTPQASSWAWGPRLLWHLDRAPATGTPETRDIRPGHRDLDVPELHVQLSDDDSDIANES